MVSIKIKNIKNNIKKRLNAQANYKKLVPAIRNKSVIGRHPLNVQIQTVSMCNAKCYFCPYQESWHKSNPGVMNETLFRKIISDLSQYKIRKFCPYLENEPLLDPHIFDRIEYGLSKLNPFLLELSTNASVLDQTKISNIINIFSKTNHEIWISFHGINKETYEDIMGLEFEKTKENVLSLIEKAQDHNLKILIRGAGQARTDKNRMPIWFNKDQYTKFWNDEFNKQGFRSNPQILFFTYHDRAGQISRNEINFSNFYRSNLKGFYCPRVDQWAHFIYTGELILCCMDYKRHTVFGNINDNELETIFCSPEFIKIVSKTIGETKSSDGFLCKKCISPGG